MTKSGSDTALFDVVNSATGEQIAGATQGSDADVGAAVAATRKALASRASSTSG